MSTSTPPSPAQKRAQHRSQTMLAAVARTGDSQRRVRLKNLSACGAMIEADEPFHVGVVLTIVRGSLQATGQIAWCRDRVCGMKFHTAIQIDDWVPPAAMPAASKEVSRPSAASEDHVANDLMINRIAEELQYISRVLDNVSDILSQDAILRIRHATQIQELCIGDQMLRELSHILTCEEKLAAAKTSATGPMRMRLLRTV